jgi:hypothetical protein
LLWLAWLVLVAFPARAHVTSIGLATLDITGDALSYRLTVVGGQLEPETARILRAAIDGEREAGDRVGQWLRDYARFTIDGEACRPGRTAIRAATTGDGKVVLDMALACPKAIGVLAIRDDWPEVMGGHFQTVLSVRLPGQPSIEFVFFEARREATVDLKAAAPAGGWLGFVAMGVEHILGGIDHLLFLLALLALARGFWPIVRIVTGFTIAHSITLSLAVLGVIDVPDRIVEPLIAATIVWVALENLLAPNGARWRWIVAAVFGLIHGLGFASALTELGLPKDAMVGALIGFNVGVELGQLAFVAVVMPPMLWLARPGRVVRLPQAVSVAVAVMGTFWLVERVFFA